MSEAQLKSIVIAPKITGGLSMIGSSLICWDILKDRRIKLGKVYHRLLLVMSAMDIFLSFSLFLSTWPIPKDTDDAPWLASGNDATCTAQGFAQVFFMPAIFYNAYLSIYYVLVIVYGWPERRIVPLERCAHAFTFLFSCVTAFTALALDMYGSNFLVWCFITGSWNLQLAMNIAWQWLAFVVVFVNMLFLSWKIGQQFRTQQKYGEARVRASMQLQEAQQAQQDTSKRARESWLSRPSMKLASWRRKSIARPQNPMASIKTQAALYALSFLLSESSNVAVSIAYYTNEGNAVPAWVLQYALITLPLQGFWNCLIHFRPRLLQWYKDKQKKRELKRSVAITSRMTAYPSTAMDCSTNDCNIVANTQQPPRILKEPGMPLKKKTSTVVFLEAPIEESGEESEFACEGDCAEADVTATASEAFDTLDAGTESTAPQDIEATEERALVFIEGSISSESQSQSTIPEIEMFYSAKASLSSSYSAEASIADVEAVRFSAGLGFHNSNPLDNSADDSFNASLHSVDAARIVAAFTRSHTNPTCPSQAALMKDRYDRRASGHRLGRGSFRLQGPEVEIVQDNEQFQEEQGNAKQVRRPSSHRLALGSFRSNPPKSLLERREEEDEMGVEFHSAIFEVVESRHQDEGASRTTSKDEEELYSI